MPIMFFQQYKKLEIICFTKKFSPIVSFDSSKYFSFNLLSGYNLLLWTENIVIENISVKIWWTIAVIRTPNGCIIVYMFSQIKKRKYKKSLDVGKMSTLILSVEDWRFNSVVMWEKHRRFSCKCVLKNKRKKGKCKNRKEML